MRSLAVLMVSGGTRYWSARMMALVIRDVSPSPHLSRQDVILGV